MDKDNRVIRVGFIGTYSNEWIAGLNYLTNLLYAISILEDKKIKPIVFVGKKTDAKIKQRLLPLALVVEHSLFDRKSFSWYIGKIFEKIFKSSFPLERLMMKYQIQVLSHANVTNLKNCKIINWIPDFQHLHLPEMFSSAEIKSRNQLFKKMAKLSDVIVVSSQDAYNDFSKFAPEYQAKAQILRFVSKPNEKYAKLNANDKIILTKKYNLPDSFFYLPNQFWKHKNHQTVFEAVKYLKDGGINIFMVCSGQMSDYRHASFVEKLKQYIQHYNLSRQIILLGLIDYADVFSLIKFSKAVINPSLFEGWSSTVEECKSVNKPMILSDLSVHREQYPSAYFFKQDNPLELAVLLKNFDSYTPPTGDYDWVLQMREFGKNYESIVLELIKS